MTENLFDDAPVVSSYGCVQAVDDGVLIHPYEEEWPWLLISLNVHQACQADADRTYDQKLKPLLQDCIMEVQAKMAQNKNVDFCELHHTVAGTVWISPNEKEGMTVYQPSEN